MNKTLEQMLDEKTTQSNNSTKIFLLEKAIAELTGTVLVLREELSKVKLDLLQLKGTPTLEVQPLEIKLTSNNDLVDTDSLPFQTSTMYLSTIKRIMDVTSYEWNGKRFQKYLLEITEKPGVYEIHRDLELKPLAVGNKLQHIVDGIKIKKYKVLH